MKRIVWTTAGIGATALTALFATMIALADPGDVFYVTTPPADSTLTNPQKTLAADAAEATFAGIDKTAVQKFGCHYEVDQNGALGSLKCTSTEKITQTAAEVWALVKSGDIVEPPEPDGGNWSRTQEYTATATPADWDSYLTSVHSHTSATVYAWKMWRDADTPTTIYSKVWPLKTAAPAVYLQDWYDGNVVKLLGEIGE